jgi:hypothetical protein
MSIARDLLMNRRQFGLAVIAAAAGIAGSRTLGWRRRRVSAWSSA